MINAAPGAAQADIGRRAGNVARAALDAARGPGG